MIKVFFILILAASATIAIIASFYSFFPKETYISSKSTLTCKNEGIRSYPLDESLIYLSSSEIKNQELDAYNVNRVRDVCKSTGRLILADLLEKPSFETFLYKIDIARETQGSYGEWMLYSFLWILGIGMSFEIARRIFYYVILGTLKPKKTRKEDINAQALNKD